MNVWSPSSRCVYVTGEVQPTNGKPSMEHWKIVSGWSEKKVKVAVPLLLTAGGPEVIDASGVALEAEASAKSEKASGRPHTRPADGSLRGVTSSHSSPSNWSRRAAPPPNDAGSYGMQSDAGSPSAVVPMS